MVHEAGRVRDGRERRRVRTLAIISLIMFTACAAVRASTPSPFAPRIHVRWSSEMTDARRADLERQLTLVQGWRRDEATWEYDLVDASPAGIQRLIHTPEIEDTHNIDRGRARVAPDAPFGTTPLADRRLEGWIHSSLFDWFTLLWVSSLFVSGVWLASSDHAGTS